ncbi:LamG-like jellyroll fold domain-containing protein [Pedobacter sp.]|uniref:LamG-like jellyroll fold domain-containing protein n=1 Tax=Pedobacter sp. TaxID=1411316 RepID=UPI0031D1735F
MKKNFTTVMVRLFCFWLIAILGSSCQSDFDKVAPLVINDTTFNSPKARKVLVLVVDGLRGVALKEVAPPNMTNLLKKSTFSYYSVSDEGYDEATTWADLFTGVSKAKHEVTSATLGNNKLNLYPVVFQRIKEANAKVRIATFSYSNTFTDNFTSDASVDSRVTYNSDTEIQNAVLKELADDNAGVVVGMYKSVNTAGSTNAYESSNQQYKNAILQFDTYVGQAMAALQSRKNYSKENWMVIITSSRGGAAASVVNDNTIFSNPKVNTFTIFYNDKYRSKLIDKPFTGNVYDGNFVRFYSSKGVASEAGQQSDAIRAELRFDDALKSSTVNPLNFGSNGDFTIELKMRKNLNTIGTYAPSVNKNTYIYQWPCFFGRKIAKLNASGGAGWALSLEQLTWRFVLSKGTGANGTNEIGVNADASKVKIQDGNWHALAIVIKTEGVKRFVYLYTDGVFNTKAEIPEALWPSIDTYNAPYTIGYIPDDTRDPFDGNVSDIRIWRKALSDETIKQFACDTYVSSSHPDYSYLASYWPCRDGAGGRFKNEILTENGNYDFKVLKGGTPLVKGTELANSTVWEKSTYIVCPISLPDISATVPGSDDITAQILSWLSIPIKENWNLDGRVFLNN